MKKIFAIALAVVMVLSIASVAAAFNWGPSTSVTTDDNFGYKVEVIKYLKETAAGGTFSYKEGDAAAINNAPVFYAVRVTITDTRDDVTFNATIEGMDYAGNYEHSAKALNKFGKTTVYWTGNGFSTDPYVHVATCRDTDTIKVTASVTAKQNLSEWFSYGGYAIVKANNTVWIGIAPGYDNMPCVEFTLDGNGKVSSYNRHGSIPQDDVNKILAFVGGGSVDAFLNAHEGEGIYMTDDNLRANFAPTYKSSDSENWKASSTPIILDPTVSIPKTGDNASVIGFAMIMVAVVAAAVAVRKVNA